MSRRRPGPELWDLPEAMGFEAKTARLSALVHADSFVPPELISEMGAAGLRIEARNAVSDAAVSRAGALLRVVPSLERVVLACVKSIVRLSSNDAQIDISHSEPRWPGIVFVSFPLSSGVCDLRLLEGIIHEAMHINLARVPSLGHQQDTENLVYSPWRSTVRPASGVLHGAYVFGCILRFNEVLAANATLGPQELRHVRKREAEISAELTSLPRLELAASLSDYGRTIFDKIVEYADTFPPLALTHAARNASAD
jgi:HEXXH motif-containing protein